MQAVFSYSQVRIFSEKEERLQQMLRIQVSDGVSFGELQSLGGAFLSPPTFKSFFSRRKIYQLWYQLSKSEEFIKKMMVSPGSMNRKASHSQKMLL